MKLHFSNDIRIKVVEIPSFHYKKLKELLTIETPDYRYGKEKKQSLNRNKGKLIWTIEDSLPSRLFSISRNMVIDDEEN